MSESATTYSIPLVELSLEQLVQLSQRLGHEIENLRGKRLYLRRKIDERIAAGERTCTVLLAAAGDAIAPGAVIAAAANATPTEG
jgi:hypothetical protein